MAAFAAKFLIAVALSSHSVSAAVTCASGYTAKTGVDAALCPKDAASCKTAPACCTAPTPAKTCATSTPICDAADYNKADTTVVPSGGDAKALCCVKKATCSAATCPAGMEADTAKKDDKCVGAASTCTKAACCKHVAGTCSLWKSGGNTCAADKVLVNDLSKKATAGSELSDCCVAKNVCTGYSCPATHQLKATPANIMCHNNNCAASSDNQAQCCESKTFCTGYTCPATHQLKATPGSIKCPTGTCTNDLCCEYKDTVCGHTKGMSACTGGKYYDTSKAGTTFTTAATDCCLAQAKCSDSANVSTGASAPTGPAFLALATFFIFAFAK